MSPVATDLIERITSVVRSAPLRLAVVFGSTARGTRHLHSDVDVGILPIDPQMPLRFELGLQAELERVCEGPVHLVRLDQASTLLKWKVANEGAPMVSDPPATWPRFVAASAAEHAELAPQLHRAEERFRAHLARIDTR